MIPRLRATILTAVVALATMATAGAQVPAGLAPSDAIFLFRNLFNTGSPFVYSIATASLPSTLDNQFRSAQVVGRGTWLVYSLPGYRGTVGILTSGKYPTPATMGISASTSSTLSSFRPLPQPSFATLILFDVRTTSPVRESAAYPACARSL